MVSRSLIYLRLMGKVTSSLMINQYEPETDDYMDLVVMT